MIGGSVGAIKPSGAPWAGFGSSLYGGNGFQGAAYRNLCKYVKTACRKAKRKWLAGLSAEADQSFRSGNTKRTYQLIIQTSKNPCYAQATWDWICLKKPKQDKKANKTKQKQTNKQTKN